MKIELSSVLIWAFDMTLKEFIKPIHDRAEHHPMAQSMVNGTISAAAYADLLANLLLAYGDVESKARRVWWVEQLDGITRFFSNARRFSGTYVRAQFRDDDLP